MVTDISVQIGAEYGAEDRSWTIGEHGFNAAENAPLDFNTFTGTNFADGYIRSGCVLGKITASGKYGPHDEAATDGRQTASGFLFNTTRIPANRSTVASDALLWHFHCRTARLPYTTGPGALTSAARASLSNVRFV